VSLLVAAQTVDDAFGGVMVEKTRVLAAENKRVLSRLEHRSTVPPGLCLPSRWHRRACTPFSLLSLQLQSLRQTQPHVTLEAECASVHSGALRAGPLSGWPHFPALRPTFPLLHQRLAHYTGIMPIHTDIFKSW